MPDEEEDDIIAAVVVSKVNIVDRSKDLMIDFGVTRHICSKKKNYFFD